jgi:hypothetical protein
VLNPKSGRQEDIESTRGPLYYQSVLRSVTRRRGGSLERLSAYAWRTLTRFRFTIGTAIGFAKFTIGRGDETETHIQEALRLSPFDVNAYLWIAYSGSKRQNQIKSTRRFQSRS